MRFIRLAALMLLATAWLALEDHQVQQVEYLPPPEFVLFAPGPGGPAVLVPIEFATQSLPILTCESLRDSWAAVGDQGRAFGGFQIRRDVHEEAMQRAGLDFWQESDRIRWAVHLWESSGWKWITHWQYCGGR